MELSPEFSRLNPISVVLKDTKKEFLFLLNPSVILGTRESKKIKNEKSRKVHP